MFALDQLLRQHRLHDLLDHGLGQRLVRDVRVMLRGDDHGVDLAGLAIHVLHGDLALRVRAQPLELAGLAQLRLALHQLVRQRDGQRHQFRRLAHGIAEHQALVAGALVEVDALAFIHALRDVGGLRVVRNQHGATLVVDAVVGVVVADVLDRLARHALVVDARLGGDLARQHHEAGIAQRFGRDARARIFREDGIEDGIGDLVPQPCPGGLPRPTPT